MSLLGYAVCLYMIVASNYILYFCDICCNVTSFIYNLYGFSFFLAQLRIFQFYLFKITALTFSGVFYCFYHLYLLLFWFLVTISSIMIIFALYI